MSYVPAPSFSPSSVYAGWHQHLRLPFLLLGFSAAYFLAAKVGIATSMPPQGIVILWPPNAIVLAALLAVGRERWLLFFIATVATEVAADVPSYPLWAAIGYGVVNFSEAALAAALLLKINRGEPSLRGVRDFIRFLIVGPLFASGMAALLGAAIYKIGAPDINYLHYWRVFWLGDALGLLTIGTTLLAWHRPAPAHRLKPARLVEAVVLSAGLLAVSGWALLGNAEVQSVYLIFPLLIWAALRFGVRGASIAIIAVAAVAIGTAVWGQGLFAHFSQVHAVVALQGLIAAVALSTFMLAFSVETSARATLQLQQSLHGQRATEVELREAYRRLEQTNTELDRTIAERTRHLRQTIDRNETLLKELHHRVKNNLQLVSSLVALHGRTVSDPETRSKLTEVQGQIGAIAATYDVLQRMETNEAVDFALIVPALCDNIERANGGLATISHETQGQAHVSSNAAVALSLALNELITNSIKHAAGGQVEMRVNCQREGENVILRIADNGPGFPPEFDFEHAPGFGMRMVRTVIGQADGQILVAPSELGAEIEIRVPLTLHQGKV